jgi:hypothetical protein
MTSKWCVRYVRLHYPCFYDDANEVEFETMSYCFAGMMHGCIKIFVLVDVSQIIVAFVNASLSDIFMSTLSEDVFTDRQENFLLYSYL